MGYRRASFAVGEHYHCYTRGIDGRITFEDEEDYRRFQEYLYLCNNVAPFDRSNFPRLSHNEVFGRPRKDALVAIGFYSLMPNHFHIGFQELAEGGSSKFLQKLGTSYSMYFNAKYRRVGGLFIGPCRSKHIEHDRYFIRVAQYIHLNAAELFERQWKHGHVANMRRLEMKLTDYPFSSLKDYAAAERPERAILSPEMMELVKSGVPSLKSTLTDAREYYARLGLEPLDSSNS